MDITSLDYSRTEIDQEFAERWPNFTPEEIYSPNCLHLDLIHKLNPYAMDALQWLRDKLGKPLLINHNGLYLRGVRTIAEQQSISNGADESMHVSGCAFDVSCKGVAIPDIADAAIECGFKGVGLYPSFVHCDLRFSKHAVIWDQR